MVFNRKLDVVGTFRRSTLKIFSIFQNNQMKIKKYIEKGKFYAKPVFDETYFVFLGVTQKKITVDT